MENKKKNNKTPIIFIIALAVVIFFSWKFLFSEGEQNAPTSQTTSTSELVPYLNIDEVDIVNNVADEYRYLTLQKTEKISSYSIKTILAKRTHKISISSKPIISKLSKSALAIDDEDYLQRVDDLLVSNANIKNTTITKPENKIISSAANVMKTSPETDKLAVEKQVTKTEPNQALTFEEKKEEEGDSALNKAANVAAAVGGLIYGGADLVSAATDVAVSTVGSELQRFLNKIATVNLQLNVDKDLAIKNSKLELLFPLCDRENDITFLQTNLHQTDARNQANVGIGYRFLTKEWILGVNAFLDYDFSHGHARASVGAEYAKDFMRISVNKYQPVTGWKNSLNVPDYQERAAAGWDVRAKFWLPQLPQLGGKLVYEQYYGDEVGLFGKTNRLKNPVSITAGIDYSPFPLLTFSLEHKQGLSSGNDTLFTATIDYQLGVPWAQQIDPETLSKTRSLIHSRYELVDRNNNIVLEYRKQPLIVFNMPKNITGYSGEEKLALVVFNTKYGLKYIDWSGTYAGKVTQKGNSYYITMPDWKETGGNSYTVAALLTDKKGNKSAPAIASITVKQTTVKGGSFKSADTDPIFAKINGIKLANEADSKQLLLTLTDASGTAQDVALSDIKVKTKDGESYKSTVSAPTRTAAGEYSFTLTSGSAEENVELTALAENFEVGTVTVEVASPEPVEDHTKFAAEPEIIEANAYEPSVLTLRAFNSKQQAVKGIASLLSFETTSVIRAAVSGANVSSVVESEAGVYSANLTVSQTGTYKVVAKYRGESIGELGVSIKAEEQTPVVAGRAPSTFISSVDTIFANNTDSATLSLTLRDKSGVVITGAKENIRFHSTDGLTVSNVPETASKGTYTATVTASASGSYRIIPMYKRESAFEQVGNLSVALTAKSPQVSGANSSFSVLLGSILANDNDTATLTLVLKDMQGVLISDQQNALSFNASPNTSVTISSITESTSKGTYTATIKAGKVGKYTIVPSYNGAELTGKTATLTASGQIADGNRSSFSVEPSSIIANEMDTATLTFVMKDASGIAIIGEQELVSFETSSDATISVITETSTAGTYTATIRASKAATYTVVPRHNGNAVGSLSQKVVANAQVPDVNQSSFSVQPSSILANNSDEATLTLVINDSMGVAIKEAANAIRFSVTPSGATISSITESATKGTYTATLKTSTANTYTVIPLFNNTQIGDKSVSVIANPQSPSSVNSEFTALPAEIVANGKDKATLTLRLNDASNVVITGASAKLKLTTTTGATISSVTESATNGTYTATITASSIGSYVVVPEFDGVAITGKSLTVTAIAQQPDGEQSSISVQPNSILANSSDEAIITLTLKDAMGVLISGVQDAIGFSSASGITFSSVNKTASKGTYTAIVTASQEATYTIVPTYNGVVITGKSTTLRAGAPLPSASKSTFSILPDTIIANNSDTATITLVMKDASGVTMAEASSLLKFTTSNGATISAVSESATKGTYTAPIKADTAATYTISIVYDGITISGKTVQLVASEQSADGSNSSFSVVPSTILANDSDKATLTLIMKDASGQSITGKESLVSFTTASGATISSVTESATKGTYTATLSAKTAATYVVIAKYNGTTISGKSVSVIANAQTPDSTNTNFSVLPNSIFANNTDEATLTIVLKDASNVLIKGASSSLKFTASPTGVSIGTITESPANSGSYSAVVKSSTANTYTMTAQFNGETITGKSVSLTAAPVKAGDTSTFDVSPTAIIANNSDKINLTLVLKDTSGVSITGASASVSFTSSTGANFSSVTESTTKGTYNATMTASAAGRYIIVPNYSGTQVASLSKTITASAQLPVKANSSIKAEPTSILANNNDSAVLTVTLKDASGELITGVANNISFSTSQTGLTIGSVSETATQGTYTANVTASQPANYTITVKYNNTEVTGLSASLRAGTPLPSSTLSKLSIAPNTIIANNSDIATLTFAMKDASGIAMTGASSLIKFTTSSGAAISSVTESATKGTYTATVTASVAANYTIAVQYDGATISGKTVQLVASEQSADGSKSSFSVAPSTILANDSDKATLTLIMEDASGQSITGKERLVSFTTASGATISSVTESTTKGTYTATLSAKTASTYVVIAKYNGTTISGKSVSVIANAQTPDSMNTNFSVLPNSIVANNTDEATLTIVLKDASNVLIKGASSSLKFAASPTGATIGEITESESKGTYTATITAASAAAYTITAQFGGVTISNKSVTLTATNQTASGTYSNFNALPNTIIANANDKVTLVLVLTDTTNVPIKGVASAVSFTSSAGANFSSVSETSTEGTYMATMTASTAGSYVIVPNYSGASIGSLSKTITANAQTPDENNSSFAASSSTIVANNYDTVTLTLSIKDMKSIVITGKASLLAFTNTNSSAVSSISSITESTNTNTKGTYTATLKGIGAGTYTIKPYYDGKQIGSLVVEVVSSWQTPDKSAGSSMTILPTSIISNGTDLATMTLVLKDKANQPITGATNAMVQFVTNPSTGLTIGQVSEDSSSKGTYKATITATAVANYTVTLKYRDVSYADINASITATELLPGDKSTFNAQPTSIMANNKETTTLTLVLKDTAGKEMTGKARSLSFTTSSGATISNVTESSTKGTYTATMTASVIGSYAVVPKYNGKQIASLSKTVNATEQSVSSSLSKFEVSPTSVIANDFDEMKVTVTLMDASNVAIVGRASKLTLGTTTGTESYLDASSFTDKGNGVYEATLKINFGGAGSYTVVPKYDGTKIGSLSKNVTATAQIPTTKSVLTASYTEVIANHSNQSIVKVVLKDASGIVVQGSGYKSNTEIVFKDTVSSDEGTFYGKFGDDPTTNGTFYRYFTGKKAGTYAMIATYKGEQIGLVNINVVAQTPDANSRFDSSSDAIVANNNNTVTLTLTMKDQSGQNMTGEVDSLEFAYTTTSGGGITLSKITEASSGIYTATFVATGAGTYTFTPKYKGKQIGSLSTKVTGNKQTPDANSNFVSSSDKIVANNYDTVTLTLTMKDQLGRDMTGETGSLEFAYTTTSGSGVTLSKITEASSGTYTATFVATGAGTYTFTPKYQGKQIGSLSTKVTGNWQTPDKATMSYSKDTIYANNSDSLTVTAVLKDKSDQLIKNATSDIFQLIANPSSNITISDVTETTEGTYTATVKASRAGSYAIKIKYRDITYDSPTVSIKAVDPSKSTIFFNSPPSNNAYKKGDTIEVTVKVVDNFNNPMNGFESYIQSNISIPNTARNSNAWKRTANGVYTNSFKAQTTGTLLQAELKSPDYDGVLSSKSAIYSITAPTFSGISVNGATFSINDGFPSIGFNGAQFTLVLSSGNVTDYFWLTSDSRVATVNNGTVTIQGTTGAGKKAVISARPNSNENSSKLNVLTYEISMTSRIHVANTSSVGWSAANATCSNLKYSLPKSSDLASSSSARKMGSLFSEWGNITNYSETTSMQTSWIGTSGYFVDLTNGNTQWAGSGSTKQVLCIY